MTVNTIEITFFSHQNELQIYLKSCTFYFFFPLNRKTECLSVKDLFKLVHAERFREFLFFGSSNDLEYKKKIKNQPVEFASKSQHIKYSKLKANNYIFNAFAVETLGCWSNDALQLVNKIGSRLNDINGDPRSHRYSIQRISMTIQRSNVYFIYRK